MNLSEYLQQNKEETPSSFGRFIRQRRQELGYTVRGFARELGITV